MYALLLGHGQSAVDNGLHLVKVKLILLGYGVGYERAALQAHVPFCLDYAGYLVGVLCVVVYLEPALAAIEGGEVIGIHAHHRYAHGLQIFKGKTYIQYGLCACANDRNGGMGQLLQIRAYVHSLGSAPVYAAYTAGGEYTYAGEGSYEHGGSNRGGAGLAGSKVYSHVPAADLAYAIGLAHYLKFPGIEAYLQLAADYGGGSGDSAFPTHYFFYVMGELQVFGVWHAVAENGALEGDYRPALVYCLLYFGCNAKVIFDCHGIYPLSIIIFSISSGLISGLIVVAADTATAPAARA